MSGGDGDDTILGGPGGDAFMSGGDGNDTIYGGIGSDKPAMGGGPGNDFVNGGFGNDSMDGGPGRDRLSGGDDNDLIDSHNGRAAGARRDFVSCGEGTDTVNADRLDVIAANCERVIRA
jgi:Ca2+-binding RTX toxin-like protein